MITYVIVYVICRLTNIAPRPERANISQSISAFRSSIFKFDGRNSCSTGLKEDDVFCRRQHLLLLLVEMSWILWLFCAIYFCSNCLRTIFTWKTINNITNKPFIFQHCSEIVPGNVLLLHFMNLCSLLVFCPSPFVGALCPEINTKKKPITKWVK